MKQGLLLSALLHIFVLLLFIFGLPFSFKKPLEPWAPIPVELVEISEETMAPKPTLKPVEEKKPEEPKPEPKPEPVPEKSEPKPEPKPEPEPVKPDPLPTPEPEPVKEIVPEPEPELKKIEPLKEKPKPEVPAVLKKKPEPKKKDKKKEDTNPFDSVLKNLEKIKKNINVNDEEEEPSEDKSSSNKNVGKLGDKVTMSEMDAVRRQLARCWNIPAGAKDAQDLIVDVKIWLNKDGTIREAKLLQSFLHKNHPFYQIASESALRAVKDPRCSPLKLPAHKYDQWKVMTLTFDPKKML